LDQDKSGQDKSAQEGPARDITAQEKPASAEAGPKKPAERSSQTQARAEKPKSLPSSKAVSKRDKVRKPSEPSLDQKLRALERPSEPGPEPADLLKTEALAGQEEVEIRREKASGAAEAKPGTAEAESVQGDSDNRIRVLAISPLLSDEETTLVRVDLSSEVEPLVKTFVNQKGQLKVSVDFPGTIRSGDIGNQIPSPSPLVKRIAVGDHKDKLRLVLDLDMSRNYSVRHRMDGRVFTLRVTPE
jgi:hypothetical protein